MSQRTKTKPICKFGVDSVTSLVNLQLAGGHEACVTHQRAGGGANSNVSPVLPITLHLVQTGKQRTGSCGPPCADPRQAPHGTSLQSARVIIILYYCRLISNKTNGPRVSVFVGGHCVFVQSMVGSQTRAGHTPRRRVSAHLGRQDLSSHHTSHHVANRRTPR